MLFVSPSGSLLLSWLAHWCYSWLACCCRCSSLSPWHITEHPHPSQQLPLGLLHPSLRKTVHGSAPQQALPQDFLPSAMILAPLCFLTSPAGNGSCLTTIILFSWWSALISSPQLVSDPEAKRTQKGKHNAESLLGLLACPASAFALIGCLKNYIKKDCKYCGSFSPSSSLCSTRHLHTHCSLSWGCCSA